ADDARIIADNLLVFSDQEPGGRPFLSMRRLPAAVWVDLPEFIEGNRLFAPLPNLGYLKPLIWTEALRGAGVRYDERLGVGEDYDLMARLLASGQRLRITSEILYLYRRHSASTSHRVASGAVSALIAADQRLAGDYSLSREALAALGRRRQALVTLQRREEI